MSVKMKNIMLFLLVLATSSVVLGGSANAAVSQEDVAQLLSSMRGPTGAAVQMVKEESARVSLKDGYLHTLGAPANHYFPVSKAVAGNPTATAKNFIAEHGAAFGVKSKAVDFAPKKSRKRNGRSYERFQQTYSQIPVFGAEVVIQLNASGGVEYVLSDIMRETSELDDGKISTVPTISSADAEFLAIDLMAQKHPDLLLDSEDAQFMIYKPSVVGNSGPTQLVWQTVVVSISVPIVNEFILIDAHTGEVALHFTQITTALNRQIYDSNNTTADPGTLRRTEGQGASGIADVDLAYTYLGDVYNFYNTYHSRDSIDGSGMTLSATVRYCSPDPNFGGCPMPNAFWNGSRMYFGEGFAADDVTAHECTHGVTQYESNLIYLNESGAINESFSDMWGEWVDLTNGAGNDNPSVRWLLGEDLPIGVLRNMANPPAFRHPDRKTSPLWHTGAGDNGGVHTNCGVGNKLCYLLTDGATFNEKTVTGMGISAVADLFYEVQTNLLTSGSDYADLYDSLIQAATNLGWSDSNKDNLKNACLATELSLTYISSAADLLAMAADPYSYDECFILTADIDMAGQVFTTAIIAADTVAGTFFEGAPFTGTFDGNSHKITNFTINGGSNCYLGLFGYIFSGGSVKNLGLENCTVSGSSGSFYVCCLVGWNKGSISNCYSTGSVSGDGNVGGLVGINNEGSISKCYSTGSVAAGGSRVGGLVGRNYDGSIIGCYSTGVVSGPSYYAGGLVGDNYYGSISNCYSTGAVSGNLYVGGLVGSSYNGGISNCYSMGSVSGNGTIGGLVGYNYGGISSCYFLVTSGPDNGLGTPLTDAQMKQQSSFTGWDFTNEMDNGTNDYWRMCVGGVEYPLLWWQFNTADFTCPDGVNIEDLDYFIQRWLMVDCNLSNNYCGGADINGSGTVDFADFVMFAENWLQGI